MAVRLRALKLVCAHEPANLLPERSARRHRRPEPQENDKLLNNAEPAMTHTLPSARLRGPAAKAVARAKAGETTVVTDEHGKGVAKVSPIEGVEVRLPTKRGPIGLGANKLRIKGHPLSATILEDRR